MADRDELLNKLSNSHPLTEKKSRPLDAVLYALIYLCSFAILAVIIYFIVYIFYRGIPTITWAFISTASNPIAQTVGILPSIINTIYMIILSLLFAVPLGVGGAIYVNEYAKRGKLLKVIEFTTETLTGIPSILYGVFGYVFFCVALNLKVSLLAGSLTLTLMVLPIIIRTTQEALRSVPKSFREGSLGIGATKWYMIRTLLIPTALPGIITSIILSVGRIVGESAALILVAGGSAMYLPKGNLLEQIMGSGSTLSVELYRYAYSRGDNDTGFAIAVVLLVIVLTLNIVTRVTSNRLKRKSMGL
jgi:phosphate transport system permease protein